MDRLWDFIFVLGGIALGLLLASCLWAYKELDMSRRGREITSQSDEWNDLRIEVSNDEIADENLVPISIISSNRPKEFDENDQNEDLMTPASFGFWQNV